MRGLLNYNLISDSLLERSSHIFSNLLIVIYNFYETPENGFRNSSIHLPVFMQTVQILHYSIHIERTERETMSKFSFLIQQ